MLCLTRHIHLKCTILLVEKCKIVKNPKKVEKGIDKSPCMYYNVVVA